MHDLPLPDAAVAAAAKVRMAGRPSLYLQVARLCGDPNAAATDVARVILADSAATAALLRLANSSLYFRTRRVSTVTEAIVLVGLDGVRAMLMTVYFQSLPASDEPDESTGSRRQALFTAVAARELALSLRGRDSSFPERCYVAGLLHHVGRQADGADGETIADLEAERARHGYSHADLGAALAQTWHLPLEICEAILRHHEPQHAGLDSALTAVLHLATALAREEEIGAPDPEPGDSFGHALEILGWTPSGYREFAAWRPGIRASVEELMRQAPPERATARAKRAAMPAPTPARKAVHVSPTEIPDAAARLPAGL